MASARPRRYAEALFAIAKERGTLDAWREDLKLAGERLGSEAVLHHFTNPELQPEQVRHTVQQLLGSPVAPEVVNLLALLISRQKLDQVPAVVARYGELVDRERRVETASVRTAVPLAPVELDRLRQRLMAQRQASAIVINQQVDPTMLGGIIVRIGDSLWDGSVDARLATLRQALLRER